jgi:hypothetical protein
MISCAACRNIEAPVNNLLVQVWEKAEGTDGTTFSP